MKAPYSKISVISKPVFWFKSINDTVKSYINAVVRFSVKKKLNAHIEAMPSSPGEAWRRTVRENAKDKVTK